MADKIVVNSAWVRDALAGMGVPGGKIMVVPLAYEPYDAGPPRRPKIPEHFSASRPLRVLMVGQMNLLKGVADVLHAARTLAGAPVEFTLVGPVNVHLPTEYRSIPNVHWAGAVPRTRTREFYDAADVLLFPSHGDGFGMVQLEAMARRLPVIASRYCGDVVLDGINGIRVDNITPQSLRDALQNLLDTPRTLLEWSSHAVVGTEFSISSVGAHLLSL